MTTLRTKTLAIIGTALAAVVLFLYGASELILMRSFSQLERQETREHAQRAILALDTAIETLNYEVGDWAGWDESYAFVQQPAANFVTRNLPDKTFSELRLRVVAFVDTSGTIVFMKWFDPRLGMEIPPPAGIQEHFLPGAPLLQHPADGTGRAGIVLLPAGSLLLASRPILTTERKGPAAGTLIMGRSLGDEEVARFARATRLGLSLSAVALSQPGSASPPSSVADPESISVAATGADVIAAAIPIRDLYGNHALTLHVETSRGIHRHGLITQRYLLMAILIVGAFFAVIMILLLERFILARLVRLGREVREIGEGTDVSRRVTVGGSDELALFERTLNGMLQALEQTQSAQTQSKAALHLALTTAEAERGKTEAIIAAIGDGISIQDREFRVVFQNEVAKTLLGDQVGKKCFAAYDAQEGVCSGCPLPLTFQDGGVHRQEIRSRTSEGSRVLEVVTSPLSNGAGETVAGIEVIRDITERRKYELLSRIELSVTAILVQAPSLEEAIPRILHCICDAIDWEVGSIWSLDQTASTLKLTAIWHPPAMPVTDFKALSSSIAFTRGSGLPGRVWEANDLVWIADLAAGHFPRTDVARACGLQAGFAFPIVLAGKFAGVMEFFTTRQRERDDALTAMLAPLGIQLGQLIERKRAEERLGEVTRQQEAILNNIPDMAWLKDTAGRFTAVNEAFGHACGLAPEQVVGKSDREIWPAELADLYTRDEKIVLQTGTRHRAEEPWLDTQGHGLVVETIRSPVLNDREEIVGITGIARDITERKRMEEALAASEANYRTIFDGANDPILVQDPLTGAILDVNRKMCQMYGYTLEEARNCTVGDLSGASPPFTAEAAFEQLAKAAAGEVRIFEWLARHRNGDLFWVEVNLKAAVIGGEERILAVIRDITERKRLEEQLLAMARHDHLTGLPNRNLLQERSAQMLAAAGRNGTGVALIFMDLNGFKEINDTLGHRAGDQVLQAFSSLLLGCVRESDTVSRFGGDEFIAVLSGIRERHDALVVVEKITAALHQPLLIEDMELLLTVSSGVALYPQDGVDLESLISYADTAMYRNKQQAKAQGQVGL